LRRALQIDKARVQIGRISRFGLLEMSRQRLRPSLGESSQETCPICDGHGTIRSVESLALSILRLIEEEVMKDYTGQIVVQAPNDVVNFLHNEKRAALADVESRHKVPIMMLANSHLVTPHFEIHRVRTTDVSEEPSYKRIDQPEAQLIANERSQANVVAIPAPAVTRLVPDRPAPGRTEEKAPGLFARLANALFSGSKEEEKPKPATPRKTAKKSGSRGSSQQSRQRGAQSSQQQTRKKRTSKKRTAKTTKTSGQQRRTSKKRTSKKTQSKSQQQKGKQAQTRNRPPRGKQQKAADGNVAASKTADTSAAPGSDKPVASDGNVKQKQSESGSRRGGRRRRSPYKTGGSSPRPERADAKAEQTAEASQKQPAKTGKKATTTDKVEKASKTEAVAAKPDTTEAPAPKAAVEEKAAATQPKAAKAKPTPETDSKAGMVTQAAAEKVTASTTAPTDSASKPAVKKPARKKSSTRKTAAKKTSENSDKSKKRARVKTQETKALTNSPAKAIPGPVAEPQQGTKGLYTLKPEPVKEAVSPDTDS